MSNDKRLLSIDRSEAQRKMANNIPVTLRELALALELGYDAVRGWKALGLPIFAKKVFPEDFRDWRKRRIEQAKDLQNGARRRSSIAGRCG